MYAFQFEIYSPSIGLPHIKLASHFCVLSSIDACVWCYFLIVKKSALSSTLYIYSLQAHKFRQKPSEHTTQPAKSNFFFVFISVDLLFAFSVRYALQTKSAYRRNERITKKKYPISLYSTFVQCTCCVCVFTLLYEWYYYKEPCTYRKKQTKYKSFPFLSFFLSVFMRHNLRLDPMYLLSLPISSERVSVTYDRRKKQATKRTDKCERTWLGCFPIKIGY